MHRLGVAEIEAVVGKPIPAVLMKQIDTPTRGSGGSFIVMLPGVGDSLRLNGSIDERRGGRLVVSVEQAFVHCPKCILRSGLWKPPRPRRSAPLAPSTSSGDALVTRAIADFLASAPFAVVSTWDASGASDTSPRGDRPGFIKLLDERTLGIPDRKGNQRIDTFHNLMACDRTAVVPGRQDVLHIHGTAWVTDEPDILSSMTLKGKAPHLALCVRILGAELVANEAVLGAKPWQASSHVDRVDVPDLMNLAAQHLARKGSRACASASRRPHTFFCKSFSPD